MIKCLVLLSFLLFSCQSNGGSNSEPVSLYMSHESVVKEYLRLKNGVATFSSETLTPEEKARVSNLTPINELISGLDLMDRLSSYEKHQEKFEVSAEDIDLRSRDTSIKDQGQYGYCTAYSGIAGIENMLNKAGKISGLNLSEWHLWSMYQKPYMNSVLTSMVNNFICDEKDYPTGGKQSASCSLNAHTKLGDYRGLRGIEGIQSALERGNIVQIALNVPSALMKCPSVVNPNSGFESGAGHALLVSGIINDDRLAAPILVLKNSWARSCGDRGYQYFPYELCTKIGGGCWAWEFTSVVNVK